LAEFLNWIEGSALGETMRGMGVWSYGIVNLTHILGISTLFGSILVADLRMLGVWPQLPLRLITEPAVPLAAAGFTVALVSGICMLSTNATDYVGNPFLLIKFPAILLGVLNAVWLSALPAWKRARAAGPQLPDDRWQLAVAGGVSLACWLVAIGSGRMIGYW